MPRKKTVWTENDLDDLFSLWVRQRDANDEGLVQCCTCGKWLPWRRMDCGHFISRREKATRFDEENTGPQCKGCNYYGSGLQFKFSQYLNEKYGEGTAQKMEDKSKMTCKRSRFDYEYLCKELTEKLKAHKFVTR